MTAPLSSVNRTEADLNFVARLRTEEFVARLSVEEPLPRAGGEGSSRERRWLLGLGKADRFADLAELAGVVVPVVVEHRADEHRDRDLIGTHELLEERDAGFALEVGITQPFEVAKDLPALAVERARELLKRHLLALGRHVGAPR